MSVEEAGTPSTSVTDYDDVVTVADFEVVTGDNRFLLVAVSVAPGTVTVSSVAYGAAALSLLGYSDQGDDVRVELWGKVAPAVGTEDVVVTMSDEAATIVRVAELVGVDQVTPATTPVGASGADDAPTVSAPDLPEWDRGYLLDALAALENEGLDLTATADGEQTEDYNEHTDGAGGTEDIYREDIDAYTHGDLAGQDGWSMPIGARGFTVEDDTTFGTAQNIRTNAGSYDTTAYRRMVAFPANYDCEFGLDEDGGTGSMEYVGLYATDSDDYGAFDWAVQVQQTSGNRILYCFVEGFASCYSGAISGAVKLRVTRRNGGDTTFYIWDTDHWDELGHDTTSDYLADRFLRDSGYLSAGGRFGEIVVTTPATEVDNVLGAGSHKAPASEDESTTWALSEAASWALVATMFRGAKARLEGTADARPTVVAEARRYFPRLEARLRALENARLRSPS